MCCILPFCVYNRFRDKSCSTLEIHYYEIFAALFLQYNKVEIVSHCLRTFARKSSNIDFFLNFHDCEFMGYSCQKCKKKKKWGVTEFVSEIRCPKDLLKIL